MIEGLESLTHPRSRRICVACETDILRTANYPYARLVNDCLYRTLPGNEAVNILYISLVFLVQLQSS